VRLKLIACEILYREICSAVAQSVNQIDVEFLPKGLHDIGAPGMSARLAEAVAGVDASRYDAILLGYALCSNGLVGLTANSIPLILPRAHDCITLFLGDRQRYLDVFQKHPGVFFKTTGWIERGEGLNQYSQDVMQRQLGFAQTREELVAKYGEDNAEFLTKQLGDWMRNYSGIVFIEMGVEPDDRFERAARDEAARRGWTFEKIRGDLTLLRQLVDGPWANDRFLTVPPGQRIAASFDDNVIQLQKNSMSTRAG
jgi:hypothetical protein